MGYVTLALGALTIMLGMRQINPPVAPAVQWLFLSCVATAGFLYLVLEVRRQLRAATSRASGSAAKTPRLSSDAVMPLLPKK
jgi:hypothetical protein